MMKQVRLCAVWPMENWLGSSLNQKAVPKTKNFREEVHFFGKSVQICAQITNCTSKKIYSPRKSALLPGRFIQILVFGTALSYSRALEEGPLVVIISVAKFIKLCSESVYEYVLRLILFRIFPLHIDKHTDEHNIFTGSSLSQWRPSSPLVVLHTSSCVQKTSNINRL